MFNLFEVIIIKKNNWKKQNNWIKFNFSNKDHDPDIIAGFEVQQSSLGYLLERAASKFSLLIFLIEIWIVNKSKKKIVLNLDLAEELARTPLSEFEIER